MKHKLAASCCVVLAACSSGSDRAQAISGSLPYTVNSVEVTAGETAAKGRFAREKTLKENTLATLDVALTETFSEVPSGGVPATAVFKIREMKLKEAAARSFGGVNSIEAVMHIADKRGRVLVKPTLVGYSDQATNTAIAVNGIPVGLLFNQIRNSTDAAAGEDLKKLIAGFTQIARRTALASSGNVSARAPSVTATASPKTGSSKPVPAKSALADELSDLELEILIDKAQRKAEAEVVDKYGTCWQIACEKEVKRARDEAEERVRRSAASAAN